LNCTNESFSHFFTEWNEKKAVPGNPEGIISPRVLKRIKRFFQGRLVATPRVDPSKKAPSPAREEAFEPVFERVNVDDFVKRP